MSKYPNTTSTGSADRTFLLYGVLRTSAPNSALNFFSHFPFSHPCSAILLLCWLLYPHPATRGPRREGNRSLTTLKTSFSFSAFSFHYLSRSWSRRWTSNRPNLCQSVPVSREPRIPGLHPTVRSALSQNLAFLARAHHTGSCAFAVV